jgi:ceramide glucosyltransferase
VLKPLFGLDKNLYENLCAICSQDYPDYQVVLAAQRLDDAAIPVMKAIAAQFGPARVTLCIVDSPPVGNGKAQNLANAYALARHDVIVISDSDVAVASDYLAALVAPLADSKVGYVCTLVRAVAADNCWERMQLLSYNADFLPILTVGILTRAADFCFGPSTAVRRETIDAIGGFGALERYMVEDAEMGRRIQARGLRAVFLPRFERSLVDLPDAASWWNYQIYWDQNARYVSPVGFLLLLLVKAVPFAGLLLLVRAGDGFSVAVFGIAVAVRLVTAALFLAGCAGDREGLKWLWLLPLRDVISVGAWLQALSKREFVRRGVRFAVSRRGLIESA